MSDIKICCQARQVEKILRRRIRRFWWWFNLLQFYFYQPYFKSIVQFKLTVIGLYDLSYENYLIGNFHLSVRSLSNKFHFVSTAFVIFIISYGWAMHEKCVFFWNGFVTTYHVVRSMIDDPTTWKTNQIYFKCENMGIANVNCHVQSCNLPFRIE